MPKQKTIKLNLNRTFEEKKIKYKANNLHVGKNDKVRFYPECVFNETGISRLKFWKRGRSLVFFVDGAVEALKFEKITDKMQTLWTKAESEEHTNKQVAKARLKMKPMTWGQVLLLAVLLVVLIVINLYSLSRGGGF